MARYTYELTIPIAGVIYYTLDSDVKLSEDQIRQKIYELDLTTEDIEEWSTYTSLLQGNVMNVSTPTELEYEEYDNHKPKKG